MKPDKYLKIILTIIALCLIWLSVKDVVIGPTALYGSTKEQVPAPPRKPTAEEKEIMELLQRWGFIGGGVDYLKERGKFDDFIIMFGKLIKAGYVPRFSFAPNDILFMEKLK